MYFIELVTTEHKLGITISSIKKKNLAPERNGSNLFLIYPISHSLHYFHTFHHSTCECIQKLSSIVFISYYPEDLPVPLTHPPSSPFYMLSPPEADAAISQAFNNLSHLLASPFFKSCLFPLSECVSLRFLIPAGRRSQYCQTLGVCIILQSDHHRS